MAVEISGLDNVLMYDMVKLECDDIKQGLTACANRFSDLLLSNLVSTHMEDNQRCVCVRVCVCVCVCVCAHMCTCVRAYMHACVYVCVHMCVFCMYVCVCAFVIFINVPIMLLLTESYVTMFHSKPDHLQSQVTQKR